MKMKASCVALCLAVAAALAAPPVQAGSFFIGMHQLHERDLNGDGQVDAYYDSVLGLTWLRDWNYAVTRQPTINGLMNWPGAREFARVVGSDRRFDPLLGGHSGWRVPDLHEFVLAFDMLSVMENIQTGLYWSDDVYPPVPELSWAFQPLGVTQPTAWVQEYTELLHVALVRTGDVPEPATLALAAAALAACLASRRRPRRGGCPGRG